MARWLALHPDWLSRLPGTRPAGGLRKAAQIRIDPPPTLSNRPPPKELDQMLHIARKFDVAGRDERNQALARAGEERVLSHEQATLKAAGRDDLARKVRWVSEEHGDGAGNDDISSYATDGRPRLIEVKTTNGWERTPFYITRNELAVANERRTKWCLFRVFLARAEGVRALPAARCACLADPDVVSGQLSLTRSRTPAPAVRLMAAKRQSTGRRDGAGHAAHDQPPEHPWRQPCETHQWNLALWPRLGRSYRAATFAGLVASVSQMAAADDPSTLDSTRIARPRRWPPER